MTGATSPWAVCLIASSVPSRSLTLCVAALTYRLSVTVCLCVCMCIWVLCVCLEAKLFSVSCKIAQKRKSSWNLRQKQNEHVKLNTACHLHLSLEYNIVFSNSLVLLWKWACQLCITAYFHVLTASTKLVHRLEMLNIFYCIKNVPYVCGGENIYSTVESLNLALECIS